MKETTKATWVPRVEEWKRSGKTAEEFANGQAFTGGTLKWRASQLRSLESTARTRVGAGNRGKAGAKVVLAEVVRQAPATRSGNLTLEIAGLQISVSAGFDKALLRDVVATLQEERR